MTQVSYRRSGPERRRPWPAAEKLRMSRKAWGATRALPGVAGRREVQSNLMATAGAGDRGTTAQRPGYCACRRVSPLRVRLPWRVPEGYDATNRRPPRSARGQRSPHGRRKFFVLADVHLTNNAAEREVPWLLANAHTGKSRGQLLPRAFPPSTRSDCMALSTGQGGVEQREPETSLSPGTWSGPHNSVASPRRQTPRAWSKKVRARRSIWTVRTAAYGARDRLGRFGTPAEGFRLHSRLYRSAPRGQANSLQPSRLAGQKQAAPQPYSPALGLESCQFQANSVERLIDIACAPGAEVKIDA